MDISIAHTHAIIELLTRVRNRPWPYIGTNPKNIFPFIDGINMTCLAIGIRRDQNSYILAVKKHGWEYGSFKPWDEMKEAGFTDEQMIQEFVDIEIDAWKNHLQLNL